MKWDEVLAQLGFPHLRYDDLTAGEKRTFEAKLRAIQTKTLSIEKEREYISFMKNAVEEELTKPDLTKEQDLYLKARLRNLLLLEAFLLSPERAKQELQRQLENIK